MYCLLNRSPLAVLMFFIFLKNSRLQHQPADQLKRTTVLLSGVGSAMGERRNTRWASRYCPPHRTLRCWESRQADPTGETSAWREFPGMTSFAADGNGRGFARYPTQEEYLRPFFFFDLTLRAVDIAA